MSNKDIPWTKLDPARAEFASTEGAYIAGQVLLVMGAGVVIAGHMTCGSKESAEKHARELDHERGDRRVTYATFKSWMVP